MSFKNLSNIKYEYRTLLDQVVSDFYIPVLKEASIYRRAVGFFSSSILLQISKGLGSLASRGGKMQLLISPQLSKEDYDAIEKGYDIREKAKEIIENSFDEYIQFEQKEDRFALLSYMISSGFLDIKIAVLEEHNDHAMYHEKLGILEDEDGNLISFTGSANESNNAFNENYEAIDVFCSWKSQESEERCISKLMSFKRLWDGLEKKLIIIPFPQVIKDKLLKYNKNINYASIDEEFLYSYKKKAGNVEAKIPSLNFLEYPLRQYQIEAIDQWESKSYRGIYDMATGTGKTFTGCGSICRLFEKTKRLFVIICCPYIHLVDQWCDEIKSFNIDPIKCYGGTGYELELHRCIRDFKKKRINFSCAIFVNKTFSSDKVQSLISSIADETLIIVDEAHNFGALKLSNCLNVDYKYRLALSATLDRYGDAKGTKKLYDFFGEKCITFDLAEAIQKGFLTPYKYYPIIVNLDSKELDDYRELSSKISKLSRTLTIDDEPMKALLIKRARIVAGARNKLNALKQQIQPYAKSYNLLVYCGAVKYGDYDYESCDYEKKQIDEVINILLKEFGILSARFTSQENAEERKNIINAYKNNDIQSLVAIKCLDEGMNVPAIKTAFILASSTNPKEYIQRRGRVLRKSSNKDFAEIFDFIVLPYSLNEANMLSNALIKPEIGLVKKELVRLIDFANLSNNPADSNSIIESIKSAYGLNIINESEDISIYD